jgi:polyisoprenoid-binding protein YceI
MPAMDTAADGSIAPPGVWSIDPGRSRVAFGVRHMVSTLHGDFRAFEGTLEVTHEGESQAFGTVDPASIDTGDAVRDERIRNSADFFDVEHNPQISFRSTRIDHLGDRRLRVSGELSMRGVTREIELDARSNGLTRDERGKEWIKLELHGELKRKDFGLTWNQAIETGGMLVGDRVKLALDISAVRSA